MHLLETDPLKVRSQAYDLVLNGWELGSGSIRIHQPELQSRIFRLLGISDEEADKRFGFFLNPFRYGAPPHGGFAFGIDRLVAILAGEENIREVIAFPKTQSGIDPMTNAPDPRRRQAAQRPRHPRPAPALRRGCTGGGVASSGASACGVGQCRRAHLGDASRSTGIVASGRLLSGPRLGRGTRAAAQVARGLSVIAPAGA